MRVTVIVPTFNEAANVPELVNRLDSALVGLDAEILFVDDSTDDTPAVVTAVAEGSRLPVGLLHRQDPIGGLGGAVLDGIRASSGEWCVVMDGDLQHPPEMVPALVATATEMAADVSVASRYCAGGSSSGLSGWARRGVSLSATALTRAMFPRRLRNCTDPMTGFFVLRRSALDLDSLRPRGFKILLEILVRQPLLVVEEPFVFGQRFAGESKADLAQGIRFVRQLAALRFGRMSKFALVGAVGAAVNIAIMAALTAFGWHYLESALCAAAITILGNFFALETLVFSDLRGEGKGFWKRFGSSVGFNTVEALLRLPILAALVEFLLLPSLLAQAATLCAAFIARFLFHSRMVYAPRRTTRSSPLLVGDEVPLTAEDPSRAAKPDA